LNCLLGFNSFDDYKKLRREQHKPDGRWLLNQLWKPQMS
jgi:hypothetical protein